MSDENKTPDASKAIGGEGAAQLAKDHAVEGSRGAEPRAIVAEAIDFLRNYAPAGPWNLFAIDPGKTRKPNGACFGPGTEAAAAQWVERVNADHFNVYYHVNAIAEGVTRADKGEVVALRAHHVDVDPRAGEDPAKERERILAKLLAHEPAPTAVVDSGGGLNAVWLLTEPTPLGDDAARDMAERRNLALELALGGDHCHDVSRILRLPGTVNWPDAKKRSKGRVPRLASVAQSGTDWSRRYGSSDFPAAQRKESSEHAPVSPTAGSGDVKDLDLHHLTDEAAAELRRVIAEGPTPERDFEGNRSGAVMWVCCELIRADVPDEQIVAVIQNAAYKISDHVRERGGRDVAGYAQRQLERALEREPRRPVLDRRDPMPAARRFVADYDRTLLRFQEEFMTYGRGCYEDAEAAAVRSALWKYLERARQVMEEPPPADFCPNSQSVNNVLDALRGAVHLPRDRYTPPCWLRGDGPSPRDLIACRNGLLNLATGELLPLTPDFFNLNALDFDYEPAAPPPAKWLAFLDQLWADDRDSVAALQEMFGYVLTDDTSLQKIFVLQGVRRSGKGTIGRVLTELAGRRNVCSPRAGDLAGTFGLQPLIGKRVALISDMRIGRHTNTEGITENLLRVSGEDYVEVHRKNIAAWEGKLTARFVLLTNELPRFADDSSALVSRYLILQTYNSFLGKEDPRLTDKLVAEMPGILNWAVAGWRRLQEQGRFTEPQVSRELKRQVSAASSPIRTFVEDRCVLGADKWVKKDDLYAEWCRFLMAEGAEPVQKSAFGMRLTGTFPKVKAAKRRGGGDRATIYTGIELAKPAPEGAPQEPF